MQATGVAVCAWNSSCTSGVQESTVLQESSTLCSCARSLRQVAGVIGKYFK